MLHPVEIDLVSRQDHLCSCGAAIAAVWIATRDRRARTAERLDAAKAQAMLVLVDVHASRSAPGFDVWVHNFGTLAVLDVEVDSATVTGWPRCTPSPPEAIAVRSPSFNASWQR